MTTETPQHTPGPWCGQVKAGGQGEVYSDRYKRHIALCYSGGDAALVAAAPDMKRAIEVMVNVFNANDIDPLHAMVAIEQAKAALSKAESK